MQNFTWPNGKRFAFTIVDDTDRSTVESAGPAYEVLSDLGFRTTKTVWPLAPLGRPIQGGQTLEDPDYQNWVLGLKKMGFEIALHGVSDEPSTRARIIAGQERFRQIIGHAPRIHVNHSGQTECIYWGEDRFDGLVKLIYRLSRRYITKAPSQFYGHIETSPYFWGDICQQTITFVRNFVFNEINTLKSDPLMPYHDPRRPYVPFWFSSSAAKNVDAFCSLLSEANQDRLVEEGGACIVYTHLGFRFYRDGRLNQRFIELMRRLARLSGWFVPASTLLTYIGEQRGWQRVDAGTRGVLSQMQRKWLLQKLGRGKE